MDEREGATRRRWQKNKADVGFPGSPHLDLCLQRQFYALAHSPSPSRAPAPATATDGGTGERGTSASTHCCFRAPSKQMPPGKLQNHGRKMNKNSVEHA